MCYFLTQLKPHLPTAKSHTTLKKKQSHFISLFSLDYCIVITATFISVNVFIKSTINFTSYSVLQVLILKLDTVDGIMVALLNYFLFIPHRLAVTSVPL